MMIVLSVTVTLTDIGGIQTFYQTVDKINLEVIGDNEGYIPISTIFVLICVGIIGYIGVGRKRH